MTQRRETDQQMEAFEYYFGLADDRNLTTVAEHYGVAATTVKNWSIKFHWQDRLAERTRQLGKKLAERTDNAILDLREKRLGEVRESMQMVRAAQATAVEKLKDGSLKVKDIYQLGVMIREQERLIKAELLLHGEATESQVIEVRMKVPPALQGKEI